MKQIPLCVKQTTKQKQCRQVDQTQNIGRSGQLPCSIRTGRNTIIPLSLQQGVQANCEISCNHIVGTQIRRQPVRASPGKGAKEDQPRQKGQPGISRLKLSRMLKAPQQNPTQPNQKAKKLSGESGRPHYFFPLIGLVRQKYPCWHCGSDVSMRRSATAYPCIVVE